MTFAEMILVNKDEYFALKRHTMNHVISHPSQAIPTLSRTLEAEEKLHCAIHRDDLPEEEKQKLIASSMGTLATRKQQMNEKDIFPVYAHKTPEQKTTTESESERGDTLYEMAQRDY